MGGIISHAKAAVARSLDNAERKAKEYQEFVKASKSAIELFQNEQELVVLNFLQMPVDGSRRPSIDEELNIGLKDLFNSSMRSSFTDFVAVC